MKAIEIILLRLSVAALAAVLQGCGTLAAPQMMMLSMASTVAGGYANGALMGGSTVGVIRNAAFGDSEGPESIVPQARTAVVAAEVATPRTVAVIGTAAMPKFANGLERACYFPNASGRGLPCT
jgi:hypothetical protein